MGKTILSIIYLFIIIIIIIITIYTEKILIDTFTTIGVIALLIKIFIAIIIIKYNINTNNYNISAITQTITQTITQAINTNNYNISAITQAIKQAINTINYDTLVQLLKNYLPVAILNGFLMMIVYIYTITKLRVDLSLATNCLKNNFYVEYSTIRYKVRSFAKKYDADLKKYLSILIISFAIAIFTILYIYYNNDIELYYIILLPILLFMVIFAIMLIDKIDGNDLGKDTTSTSDQALQIDTILYTFLTFPLIGITSVAFLI